MNYINMKKIILFLICFSFASFFSPTAKASAEIVSDDAIISLAENVGKNVEKFFFKGNGNFQTQPEEVVVSDMKIEDVLNEISSRPRLVIGKKIENIAESILKFLKK